MIFFKMTQTYSRLVATLFFSMLLVACGGGGSGSAALPTTYDMTGQVSSGIKTLSGVTVTMTGTGVSKSAVTGATGSYTITAVTNGTYTFTPTKIGETFTPSSLQITTSAGVAAPTFGIN